MKGELCRTITADGLELHGFLALPEGKAAIYLDIFDDGSKLRMFNLSRTDSQEFQELRSIRIPVLAVAGSVEESFLGAPTKYLSLIEDEMENTPAFSGVVIEGAPHNYLDFEKQVALHIGKWLGSGIVG